MTFVDTPLPASLELKPIASPKRGRPFGPDNPPPGRKGAVAKVTRDLKQGIIDAAVNIRRDGNGEGGLTGYLEDLALNHKRAFASLLVKILPLQIAGNGSSGPQIGTVNIVSIPHDTYLSSEDITRIRNAPAQLEHGASFERVDEQET